MTDSTPNEDPLANGLDKGTGNPGDDRAFLMDQPPVQAEPSTSEDDEDDEDE